MSREESGEEATVEGVVDAPTVRTFAQQDGNRRPRQRRRRHVGAAGGGAIDTFVQQFVRAREVGGTEGVDFAPAIGDESEPL